MNKKILIILFFIYGLPIKAQNSDFIILSNEKVIKDSPYQLRLKTDNQLIRIDSSGKILYDKFNVKNDKIRSLIIIGEKDTLTFFKGTNVKFNFNDKKQSLSFITGPNAEKNKFDYEYCKKNGVNIILNLSDDNFKEMAKELFIGLENPGRYDKELTSRYRIRKEKKEFKKRKEELQKHFENIIMATLKYDNVVDYCQIKTKDNNK